MNKISTNQERQPFENLVIIRETQWLVVFKRVVLAVVAVHLVVGAVSSYRAWFQVHRVEINTSEKVVHEGSIVQTSVVSYGRTPVDVSLDLIQDGRVVTLDKQRVPANEFGFYDPRAQSLTFATKLDVEHLGGFTNKPAILRATAVGRHQWTRLPRHSSAKYRSSSTKCIELVSINWQLPIGNPQRRNVYF